MNKKLLLDNGLRVVLEEIPYVRSVSIGVWVGTGARYEDEINNGISHFIEHMMFKGTKNRTAKEIAETLDRVGGQLNAFTGKEFTCYYARVLDSHTTLAIELLSDMFLNSLFDPEEIEKEKNVVIEEIKMYEDTPDELVHDLLAQSIWEDHPLGMAILGREDIVNNISTSTILDYIDKYYGVNNTVISVAGNFKTEDVMKELNRYFGSWKREVAESNLKKPVFTPKINIKHKDTEQIHLCLGTQGVSYSYPDKYAYYILDSILGGSVSSRLFQELREARGLVYSVFSSHNSYYDTGLFSIYAGTSPERIQEVLKLVMNELKKVKMNKLDDQELSRAKEQLKGNLLLSLESTSSRMSRNGKGELCYNRFISFEEITDQIDRVTADDVLRVANAIFRPETLCLAAIGPIDEKEFLDFTQML